MNNSDNEEDENSNDQVELISDDEYDENSDDFEDDSDIPPKECLICGGPYPQCRISCNLFDD